MSKQKSVESKLIWPNAGRYVVAVSGGVDSVALLNLLASEKTKRDYELTVAYFDHGWRDDTKRDREAVSAAAERHQLTVHFGTAKEKSRSEAEARRQRYEFLESVRRQTKSTAIITAHHADDWLETAVFNTLRGTGLSGQVLTTSQGVLRPVLAVGKAELLEYARQQELIWQEDSTNADTTLARNFLRREFLPTVNQQNPDFEPRAQRILVDQAELAPRLEAATMAWITNHGQPTTTGFELDRVSVNARALPELEVILLMLMRRLSPAHDVSQTVISEAARFAKAGRTGQRLDLGAGLQLVIAYASIELVGASSRTQKSRQTSG
jgi:tRNA(Ile)-lysidine synthetase-like protein